MQCGAVQVAGLLEQQNNLTGALSWLERAGQAFPGDALLLVRQGRLHHRLGYGPRAAQCASASGVQRAYMFI